MLSDHWTSSRDPNEGTTEVDPRYLETVTYHNRQFQQFSIDNSICFSPVDEVIIFMTPTEGFDLPGRR